MFNKKYQLSLTKEYVRHWGVIEATRELIQNAIDSESPFVYEFSETEDGSKTLLLMSEMTTLHPQSLLLGSTSKDGNKNAIGSFGEGYKIAMLVLLRESVSVEIFNGDKLWSPSFEYNKHFGEELLVVQESQLNFRNKGLTFKLSGLSDEDVGGIIDSCLLMQNNIGEIKSTKYGDILLGRKGKLYVGNLFICETDKEYGYNIKPEYVKLERDRQTVDDWDLSIITKNMWFETGEFEKIACMIKNEVEDVRLARFGSPDMVKDACYRLFKKTHPNSVIVGNQEDLEKLIKSGLERVVHVGVNFHSAVTESVLYKHEKPVDMEKIENVLSKWLEKNKFNMHHKVVTSFKEDILKQSKFWLRK